jgi:hypothetical protein
MNWDPFSGILLAVPQIWKEIVDKYCSGDDLYEMLIADLTRVFASIQQTTHPDRYPNFAVLLGD